MSRSRFSAKYYLENDDGTFLVWGSAVIDDRMQYIKNGDLVRITYLGKNTNKKNQSLNIAKDFLYIMVLLTGISSRHFLVSSIIGSFHILYPSINS